MGRTRFGRAAGALLAAVGVLGAGGAARAHDYALLVGASKYEKSGLKALKYTKDDVVEFADELAKSGYNKDRIVLMHDAQADPKLLPELRKINDQIDLLLAALEREDSIVVALAGHGVQFENDRVNYFCPIDAELERRESLLSLQELYERLDRAPAGHKLLLVDACRNDPQSQIARGTSRLRVASVTRPQGEPIPPDIAAIFSCAAGQESFEDVKLGHGLFFYHVVRGWRGAADGDPERGEPADGRITFEELSRYVKDGTRTYARTRLNQTQTPVSRNETAQAKEWVLRDLGRRISDDLKRADQLRAGRKYAAAADAYTRAIRSDPGSARPLLGRGLARLALGDTAAAISDFDAALGREPRSVKALICRGGARGRAGDYPGAIEDYAKAIEIDGSAVDAYVGRAAASIRIGKIDEAIADLNRAIQIDPDNADAYYNRALARKRKGSKAAADADFRRAEALGSARP